MIKLGIGLPAYRGVIASQQARMWMQLGGCITRPEFRERIEIGMIADLDMCGIDNARNTLLKLARHGACDWLLMIDSDTWVGSGADLIRMILDAETATASVIGAIVRTRGVLSPLNVYRYVENHNRIEGEARVVRAEAITPDQIPGYCFEVGGIGAAVLAVNLRRTVGLDFRFVTRDGISVSEDLEFCRRVNECGGFILADPRIKTFHLNKPDILVYEGG